MGAGMGEGGGPDEGEEGGGLWCMHVSRCVGLCVRAGGRGRNCNTL